MASTELDGGTGRDSWAGLGRHTPARIALGRSGGSLRTAPLLDFRLAHARARDAVRAPFHAGELIDEFARHGIEAQIVTTRVGDRETFLVRPDLGRALSERSRDVLRSQAADWGRRDLVVIVSDGLSPAAAERHAGPLLAELLPRLAEAGWSLYPVLLAPFGRVKLQDEVGRILGARQSMILLGERPGLGAPDSLGAYLTWDPAPERTDAERNCVSNIRPGGLPIPDAAGKLLRLLAASAELKLSGVALKEDAGSAVLRVEPPGGAIGNTDDGR
jgi:ethanolamine ammonia-lyase small subunit